MIVTVEELETIRRQAVDEYPRESCGVVLTRGRTRQLIQCRNIQDQLHQSDPGKHPLARYMFYSPNTDDDGHDPVLLPGAGLRKALGWLDRFLKNSFPVDEKAKGTLVVVTFDVP